MSRRATRSGEFRLPSRRQPRQVAVARVARAFDGASGISRRMDST
jgi:hypothetical protein